MPEICKQRFSKHQQTSLGRVRACYLCDKITTSQTTLSTQDSLSVDPGLFVEPLMLASVSIPNGVSSSRHRGAAPRISLKCNFFMGPVILVPFNENISKACMLGFKAGARVRWVVSTVVRA